MNKNVGLNFTPTLDGVLFKDHGQLMTQDGPLYDPNLNWVFMGTCADEGSMFTAVFNVTNPQNIEKLRTRLSALEDRPIFDQLFGVPKTNEDATRIGERLAGNCLFQYPVSLASGAILAHPSCQLTRYHVDVQLAKMDEMSSTFKSYHGVDVPYVFGNKTASSLLSAKEMSFSKEMQGIWIDVITSKSPEESSLPKVKNIQSTSIPGEEEAGGEACADLKVGKGLVERMPAEEVGLPSMDEALRWVATFSRLCSFIS